MLTIPQGNCIDNLNMTMIKSCDFGGRARRSEFWFFQLSINVLNFLYHLLFIIILEIKKDEKDKENEKYYYITEYKPAWIILLIINILFILPGISVSVRRLHDVNRSGCLLFLNLIPLIGQIILLNYYLQDSFPDANNYGACPKYISPQNDFSKKSPFIGNNNIQTEMQDIP